MFQKIAPILSAYNLNETNIFYKNKLKFNTQYFGNYLVVRKDQIEIHFIECAYKENFVAGSCYIYDNNVEDLYAKFCSLEIIDILGEYKDNARGKKEFSIIDNNGNRLVFGEEGK